MKLIIHLSGENGVPITVFCVEGESIPEDLGDNVVVIDSDGEMPAGSYSPSDERVESIIRGAGLFNNMN